MKFIIFWIVSIALLSMSLAAPTPNPQAEIITTLLRDKKAVEQERSALQALETKLAKAPADDKATLQTSVEQARIDLARHEGALKEMLLGVAGLDDTPDPGASTTDLTQDVKEVVQPFLHSLKEIVAQPRKTAELQATLAEKRQLTGKYAAAAKSLKALATAGGDELREMLAPQRKELESNQAHLPVEINNLERELAELEKERKPWQVYASEFVRDSVLKRAVNLLLACWPSLSPDAGGRSASAALGQPPRLAAEVWGVHFHDPHGECAVSLFHRDHGLVSGIPGAVCLGRLGAALAGDDRAGRHFTSRTPHATEAL